MTTRLNFFRGLLNGLILSAILWVLLIAGCHAAFSGQVTLTWDKSTTPNVTNYVLYAHTNMVSKTNVLIKAGVGTNTTVIADGVNPGQWNFAVSAVAAGGESDLSNVVPVTIPVAPTNARVVIEYSVTLTNWTDTGYFRLRIQP